MRVGASPSLGERGRWGITVPEMAVVVVILGLLAATLAPGFVQSVYRARRTESLYALRAIHDAETFHFVKDNAYTDSFADLGISLDGGRLRPDGAYEGPHYTYSLDTWAFGGKPAGNYRATATGNIDASDAILDIVVIENVLWVKDGEGDEGG